MFTFKGLPVVECARGESVWQAAERLNYCPPLHRVGATAQAGPSHNEALVAFVRAGRHALPIPIFRKEIEQWRENAVQSVADLRNTCSVGTGSANGMAR